MAATLGAIQAATSLVLGKNELSIDNWTFKLFYQWSTTMLVGFSILISCNQYFGDPIQCDLPGDGVNEKVLKQYCWMYSSFNIPSDFEGNCARQRQSDHPMYNSYYQWVSIFLVFQAILFYIPRVIWLMLEGGLMKFLGKGTTGRIIEDGDDKRDKMLRVFRDNLQNKYNRYAFIFFACEVLNLIVVISQFLITNIFLEYQFTWYGPTVWRYYNLPAEESAMAQIKNPMCEVFPRVASCTYWRYGSGGGQTQLQALCILSLNIVIDKVYLILWYWYLLVTLLGAIRVLCRVVQILSPHMRYWLMKLKMHRYFKNKENTVGIKSYIHHCTIGDWFVLYQMSKNLNRKFFYDFLIQLSKDVKNL